VKISRGEKGPFKSSEHSSSLNKEEIMKLRHLFTLLALLACLAVSSPALAAPIFQPIDPGIFMPPVLVLDPCFGADLVTNIDGTYYDYKGGISDTDSFTAVLEYELALSGTPVAHVISHYKRIQFGADSLSNITALDDTFVIYGSGANLTVFGRAVHVGGATIIGANGVITGAVTFNGQSVPLKGTYRITSFGGPPNRVCFFVE
jgi:hypothetical protein